MTDTPDRLPESQDGSSAYKPGSTTYSPGNVANIGSAESQQEIKLVELRTKQVCWQVFCEHDICHPVLSSNGRMLAFTVLDQGQRTLEVWDTSQGKRIARMKSFPDWTQCKFLPNSNILTAVDAASGLVFLGIPSWKKVGTLEYPTITAFALCPAGSTLAIGDAKNAIDMWGLDRARLGRKDARNKETRHAVQAPSQAELSRWYEALAGTDAKAARESMESLEGTGDRGVEFLETSLKAETVAEAEILALVRELDSDKFGVRQQALKRLRGLARIAKRQLQEQLKAAESTEVRTSLQRVLADADNYSIYDPECLRCIRAIECLEIVASARARRLLTRLASGSPSSLVTQDASAALVRMNEWMSAD